MEILLHSGDRLSLVAVGTNERAESEVRLHLQSRCQSESIIVLSAIHLRGLLAALSNIESLPHHSITFDTVFIGDDLVMENRPVSQMGDDPVLSLTHITRDNHSRPIYLAHGDIEPLRRALLAISGRESDHPAGDNTANRDIIRAPSG